MNLGKQLVIYLHIGKIAKLLLGGLRILGRLRDAV